MEYILKFNIYSDDLVLEKLNIKSLFNNFKLTSNKNLAIIIVSGLLSIYSISQSIEYIYNKYDINYTQKELLINTLQNFKNPLELRLSQNGWDFIRQEEKLKLRAYDLKDGYITIGYGHAEPVKTSKFRVGDKISKEDANKLLIKDINTAAKGVKRMFEQWKKQGIDIKITQNQYDVLVSIAFNMGIGGLRNSDFIQHLKNNDLESAAELIKTTGISDKFRGLEIRRQKEYEKFIS